MEYVVHTIKMGDVEDPDIYVAEPMYQWEHSDEGQWIMKHAIETPVWNRIINSNNMCYEYTIRAKLTDEHYTYWKLKYE